MITVPLILKVVDMEIDRLYLKWHGTFIILSDGNPFDMHYYNKNQ